MQLLYLERKAHLLAAARAHEHLWSCVSEGAAGRQARRQVRGVHDARQPHIPCAHDVPGTFQQAPVQQVCLPKCRLPILQVTATSLARSPNGEGQAHVCTYLGNIKAVGQQDVFSLQVHVHLQSKY